MCFLFCTLICIHFYIYSFEKIGISCLEVLKNSNHWERRCLRVTWLNNNHCFDYIMIIYNNRSVYKYVARLHLQSILSNKFEITMKIRLSMDLLHSILFEELNLSTTNKVSSFKMHCNVAKACINRLYFMR